MASLFLVFSALFGFFAVALGAFAAHGLKTRLTAESLAAFHTGVQYQMYHALALLALVGVGQWLGGKPLFHWAGGFWVLGVFLFSGSLYALALGGPRWLGPVTPLGGLCFLLGWACLGLLALKAKL